MGLDIYAGPLTRYVAGNWMTAVQQAGAASGFRVEVMRMNEPEDAVRDLDEVFVVVEAWKNGLVAALGVEAGWMESRDGAYSTDKPDWDGYGAVVLLAAYDEQPDLAPGSVSRRGLRRTKIEPVPPRAFPDAAAFKSAQTSPSRYPTLLGGAEWCLPLEQGPTVFQAQAPNGSPVTMGRVPQLVAELHELNDRTLRLASADLSAARQAGPPRPGADVEDVAPFGLAVLLAEAEFAAAQSVPWIMDY